MGSQIKFSNFKFCFTKDSIFGALSSDGRSYEFIIISKVNDLTSCSSGCMLSLPYNEDLHEKNGDGKCSKQKIKICNLVNFLMKIHVLNWSIITLPKVEEALSIDSGKEECFIRRVDFNEQKEYYDDDDDQADQEFNPFDNTSVTKMMAIMGYTQGMGLGRCNQGPSTFTLETEMRKTTFGLGYRPTALDEIRRKKIIREKARAKAKEIQFEVPMKPYPRTLNGQFVRAGERGLFWGFNEPVIVPTGWGDEDLVN